MKKLYILFSFSIFSLFFLNTEDVDLDSAIDRALKQNYDLKKESLNLFDKKITVYDSWNIFSPSVSAGFSLSKKYDLPSSNTTSSSTNNPSFSIGISQPIEIKMIFNVIQNYYDYKDGKISFEKYKKNLTGEIKKNYFSLVLMHEQLKLKKVTLDNAKERYEQSIIQFKSGEISELEKMNRELSYKMLSPEYTKAENDYNYSLDQFKILLGIEVEKEIKLTTEIPDMPDVSGIRKKIEDINLENNQELLLANNKVAKDAASRNVYIAQMMPTFSFSYNFTNSFQKDPFTTSWFEKDWKQSNTIGFNVSWKLDYLLPLSSLQLNIIKMQDSIKRDELDIKKIKERNKSRLDSILARMDQLAESYENLEFNINLSRQVYKYTLNEFKSGSKNMNDLKDAESNMTDAYLKLLAGRYEFISLICDLELLLNVNIE